VQISFTHLHLIRAVIGAALYLAVIALFSLALGTRRGVPLRREQWMTGSL